MAIYYTRYSKFIYQHMLQNIFMCIDSGHCECYSKHQEKFFRNIQKKGGYQMSNFMFSLNATLPVFLVIVLGWFLMQKKMFNDNFVDIINKFVFKVSLPVLLFKDIATTHIKCDC